jgi:hypothetical protein
MMMNAEQRRALEERRRELQQKLRLEAGVRGVKQTLDYLAAHGIEYQLEWDPAEGPTNWIARHFPNVGYSTLELDWSRHPGAIQGPEENAEPADVIAWFDALEAAGRVGDCDVVIFTDNGADPMIHLRFADIRARPGLFALDGWVWWIVCQSCGWVVQYGSGDPWWWGRAAH